MNFAYKTTRQTFYSKEDQGKYKLKLKFGWGLKLDGLEKNILT